jgi:hypothetical protein
VSTIKKAAIVAVNGPFHGQTIAIEPLAESGHWDLDWSECTAGTYLYRKSKGSCFAFYGGFTPFPNRHPRAGESVAR